MKRIYKLVLLSFCFTSLAHAYDYFITNKSNKPIFCSIFYGQATIPFFISTDLGPSGEQVGGIIMPGQTRTIASGASCSRGIQIDRAEMDGNGNVIGRKKAYDRSWGFECWGTKFFWDGKDLTWN